MKILSFLTSLGEERIPIGKLRHLKQSTKVHKEIPCEESQRVSYIFWIQYLLYT